MKMMRINPLWIFWLFIGLTLQFIGAVIVANKLNIMVLPLFVTIINIVFILYCFVPKKVKKK